MTAYARLPALRLRLVATHFGLSRHERCRQVAALRRIVAADRSAPLLLLGDFNEWLWPHRNQRDIFSLLGAWTRPGDTEERRTGKEVHRRCNSRGSQVT